MYIMGVRESTTYVWSMYEGGTLDQPIDTWVGQLVIEHVLGIYASKYMVCH